MARQPTWPRVTCSECGRSVALDWSARLVDHNAQGISGGLFRNRRFTGDGLCPGSAMNVHDNGNALRAAGEEPTP